MKKLSLSLVFLALATTSFGAGAYALREGDTVKIGNDYIERVFKFNGGALITTEIKNKATNKALKSSARANDLRLPKENGKIENGYFTTRNVAETAIQKSRLECEIGYDRNGISVKRIFKIYDDSPTISCDTYFKGEYKTPLLAQSQSFADKRNIESISVANEQDKIAVLDSLDLAGKHWKIDTVEFFDATDHNNTLTDERSLMSYRKNALRGNLLFAKNSENGFGIFWLKEAPCSTVQLSYPSADFIADFGKFALVGCGLDNTDIKKDEWTKAYGYVFGVWDGGELERLLALRKHEKNARKLLPKRDEMVMMNTWGDRGQDKKVTESFCMNEISRAAKMGVTHFQIDDGWQEGKSANSAYGGSFKNIWSNPRYWEPDAKKYPHGLSTVVEHAKKNGVELCVWFNPSFQDNYADWQKDVAAMNKLYDTYGIRTFKIDGLHIPNNESQEKIRAIFDAVLKHTNDNAVFNVDATAGRRGGYFFFSKYGNIFLENRYTDWQNYYPYWTLRNLWTLAKYVPAERLQIEFLNNARNVEKYGNDKFAPSRYTMSYLFSITMAAQPLVWMEASGLDETQIENLAPVINSYNKIQHDIHSGAILPIGEEPSGTSWTGFQSIVSPFSGYLILYRELNDRHQAKIKTWLPQGMRVVCTPLMGQGKAFESEISDDGFINVKLKDPNSFSVYKYEVIR